MGDSDKPGHGARVSRIAADVNDLLVHLSSTAGTRALPSQHRQSADTGAAVAGLQQKVVLCGCSLGFTIICLYLENYGTARIAGVSFVDQSAAMYHRPGWVTGAPDLSDPAMCAGPAARKAHNQ